MRILIVDDDYVSRVKLSKLLSAYGHCDSSPNGDIAIRLFESAYEESVPYELVTMDIEMPDMIGQEVVTRFRELEKSWAIAPDAVTKILMVTAKRTVRDIASSYYEGCDGYVTKPTKPDDLYQALAKIGFKI
jgi:two-component system chemotaxis response regulator CheY